MTTRYTPQPAEDLLTPAEVANMFRVDPKTVTRWAQAGKLTSVRTLGQHRRYRATEVHAMLSFGTTAAELVARPKPEVSGADLSMRFKAADSILNNGRLGNELRDYFLSELSPHGQPGPYIEHAVECHRLWAEALPDEADEAAADAARRKLDEAIRDLITPAGGAR